MINRGVRNFNRVLVALGAVGLAVGCSPKSAPPTNDDSPTPNTSYGPVVNTSTLVAPRLVAEVDSFQPGTPFRLGVVFRIVPKTHIYYRYSGSTGLPTEVEWTMPDGFKMGPLEFPNPERFEDTDLGDISYGYENEVLLFAEVKPPNTPVGSTVSFEAQANWLACMEDGLCIPGDAKLALELTAGEGAPSADATLFATQEARIAMPSSTAPVAMLFATVAATSACAQGAKRPRKT